MPEGIDDPIEEAVEIVQEYDTERTTLLTKAQNAVFRALENEDITTFEQLSRVANNIAKQTSMSLEEKQWFATVLLAKSQLEAEVHAFLVNHYPEYQTADQGRIYFTRKEIDDERDISDIE